jgi:cobalt-zinc-cadmium efflux system outer membrane protein
VETYRDLSAARMEAEILKADVLPGAGSAFEAAVEGYRQGKFGYLDVLNAQRTLFQVRRQYIETLKGYHQAAAAMERLIGEPLSDLNDNPDE